ncbi:MAG: adenine deaminase, partial [Thermodesulfobacteriota bacterium]
TVDLAGRYIAPGFIDGHVHIESSMASVVEFARAVLPCGTTTVAADPHEIANVLGAEGIRYMLDSAEGLPVNILFSLPSCVPATEMETAGARLGAAELAPFMDEDRIIALAEMMNYPGVIHGDPDVLAKIDLAHTCRKPVDGHAPGLTGPDLHAYLAAGIASDHECTTAEEAREKLAAGMFIMVREGTCAQNLETLFPAITERNYSRMMWCTDDRHPHDILGEGHVDHIIRKAIGLGLDPIRAIQMATLHPARYFGIRHAGAIAPGYRADLVVFSDLNEPRPEQVYCRGVLAAEAGLLSESLRWPAPPPAPNAMNLRPADVDFSIPAQGRRLRVIEAIPGQVVTCRRTMDATVTNGMAVADIDRDLLKIAVVERYTGKANTGKGFVTGMGLKAGALAASVAHDSHNIIVVGANDDDMKVALTAVVEMGGGFAAVRGGSVLEELPLPIAGLMSDLPMGMVRDQLDRLIQTAQNLGSPLSDPFMTLGFLALPVIPALKITDKGLVDVEKFEIASLFEE